MPLKDLNIHQWQHCLTKFLEIHKDAKGSPAIRIENTPLTSARYAGGMTYDGHVYTYFEPIIPGNTNLEGLPAVAWLMVRDDFLKFAKKEVKDFNSEHDNSNTNTEQGELGICSNNTDMKGKNNYQTDGGKDEAKRCESKR